ncbi:MULTISPECIES: hypothetical protein [Streptomyces]|uniref:Uncharacterized protein n=1 Tax=Streptomyces tsukubensis (strain DSM 42081 / NBRC 108919 / NRRL 18488 / 9993) TaxID=1114943 RepID=I2NB19_STRT9|nr:MULTISPECIES: hypothetical protein [Streptomyces]AZK97966.1 hypothetical protein B7R87_31800 [Streptomyces tsukubensis]EIF94216.1 hypothetical protein [Streptomyces tsukubensis NRRL18488]MYS64465.1 hypothetical protein [Streptomyces sp. SID5473]QKM66110.1 hypothetical protein STSU_001985 [Streptomyces tsukubensis NRRL18488]TAI42393.1 hypothetical protein EWI31_22720 [Streptomyces tsukubensis]
MIRRIGIVLGSAALTAGALALTATPSAAAAPTAEAAAVKAAAAEWPWIVHGYYPTEESCKAAGTAGEVIWGKVWWCSPHSSGGYALWARI